MYDIITMKVVQRIGGIMEFKNSKTFQNVMKTLEGELKASTKYEIYGLKAKEDGYEQIGNIFEETSRNEREHAETMMKIIYNGEVPDTLTNLRDSSKGESHEWSGIYQEFAKTAQEEGYGDIANLFRNIASVEETHDYRFTTLADNIESNEVFCKKEEIWWVCLNCGFMYYGECAPIRCPLCGYPQGYFKAYCQDY